MNKDSTVLQEAGIQLQNGKATEQMTKSIYKLAKLLVCPLCDKVFDKPTTLASCAHSFCVDCIDNYACSSWNCPVDGCGMPLSITGGHKGSYRKINPQLSQTVESLKIICQRLNTSSDYWWKLPSTIRSIQEMYDEKQEQTNNNNMNDDDDDDDFACDYDNHSMNSGDDDDDDDDERQRRRGEEESDKEEEIVDLQPDNGEDDGRLKNDDDEDDGGDVASIDSDDSIWDQRN